MVISWGRSDDGVMHHLCVLLDQPIRIETLRLFCGALLLVAKIGEKDVVHLQVAAAGLIKLVNSLVIGARDICKQGICITVIGIQDVVRIGSEMTGARSGNRDLRGNLSDLRKRAKVVEHGMIVWKVELADDGRMDRSHANTGELHALIVFPLDQFESVQRAQKVQVPE